MAKEMSAFTNTSCLNTLIMRKNHIHSQFVNNCFEFDEVVLQKVVFYFIFYHLGFILVDIIDIISFRFFNELFSR